MCKENFVRLVQVLQLNGLESITPLLDNSTSSAVKKLATAALMGLTLDEPAKVAIIESAGKAAVRASKLQGRFV